MINLLVPANFSSNQCHPSFSGGRGMSCLANFLNISAYKGLEESRLRQVLLTARKTTGWIEDSHNWEWQRLLFASGHFLRFVEVSLSIYILNLLIYSCWFTQRWWGFKTCHRKWMELYMEMPLATISTGESSVWTHHSAILTWKEMTRVGWNQQFTWHLSCKKYDNNHVLICIL